MELAHQHPLKKISKLFFFLFEGSPKTLGQHKRCEISQHFFISNEPLPKFTLKSHKLLFKKGSFSGTPSRIENLQLQILRQKKAQYIVSF